MMQNPKLGPLVWSLLRNARNDSRETLAAIDYLQVCGYSAERAKRACRRYYPPISILSIDAWYDGESWTWNNWHRIGSCDVSICDMETRALLRWLRTEGYLGAGSAGLVAIEDDGYNVVICERSTGMPVIALAYGEVMQ
jgi:hypothetical protein